MVVAVGYVHPLRAYRQAQDDVDARKAQVTRLAHRNAVLDGRIEEAKTDKFVERAARRLGLVKPGERLFVVTEIDQWKREQQGRAGAPLP